MGLLALFLEKSQELKQDFLSPAKYEVNHWFSAKEYDMDNPSLLEIMVEYCICSFRAQGGYSIIFNQSLGAMRLRKSPENVAFTAKAFSEVHGSQAYFEDVTGTQWNSRAGQCQTRAYHKCTDAIWCIHWWSLRSDWTRYLGEIWYSMIGCMCKRHIIFNCIIDYIYIYCT